MPDADPDPGLPRKVAFWVLLGLTSTAFAELLFPNTPLGPIFLVIVPVYLTFDIRRLLIDQFSVCRLSRLLCEIKNFSIPYIVVRCRMR